jgi:hypothetical protein
MHARNAVNFANIQTVDAGYAPTRWQRDTFPEASTPSSMSAMTASAPTRLTPDPGGRARRLAVSTVR